MRAVDESGALVDSEVILWLDRDPAERRRLSYWLTTAGDRQPGHLLCVLDAESAAAGNRSAARVTFVRHVIEGDFVFVSADNFVTSKDIQILPRRDSALNSANDDSAFWTGTAMTA